MQYVPRRKRRWRKWLTAGVVLSLLGGVFWYFLAGAPLTKPLSEVAEPWADEVPADAPPPWAPASDQRAPSEAQADDSPPAASPSPAQGSTESDPSATDGPVTDTSDTGEPPHQDAPTQPSPAVSPPPMASAGTSPEPANTSPPMPSGAAPPSLVNTPPKTDLKVPARWPVFTNVSPETRSRLGLLRASLANREIDTVIRQLAEPVEAKFPGDRTETARLGLIASQLDRFWRAVDASLASLQPGDVLSLPQVAWEATVVEKLPGSLVLSRGGKTGKPVSTYRRDIHGGLAAALAERQLLPQGAGRFITLAVFWSFEPGKHPEVAAQYWQRAYDAGLAVGVLAPDVFSAPPGPSSLGAVGR